MPSAFINKVAGKRTLTLKRKMEVMNMNLIKKSYQCVLQLCDFPHHLHSAASSKLNYYIQVYCQSAIPYNMFIIV